MARHNDWIFSKEELMNSPSRRDGVTWEDELRRRRDGCRFIDQLCKALELVKLVQIASDYYFHRFFMRQSIEQHDIELVACACVLVASKVEDNFRKIAFFARAFVELCREQPDHRLGSRRRDEQTKEELHQLVTETASQIITMESLLLHVLAYDLVLKRPHEFVNDHVIRVEVVMRQQLSEEQIKELNAKIKHAAWSLLNDSAYTCAYLCSEANDLAAGAVYLAGLHKNNLPSHWVTEDGRQWWTLLQTPLPVLQEAAKLLLLAYVDPYVEKTPSSLEKLVYQFQPALVMEFGNDASYYNQQHVDSSNCLTSPECASSCPNDSESESNVGNLRDPESPASIASLASTGTCTSSVYGTPTTAAMTTATTTATATAISSCSKSTSSTSTGWNISSLCVSSTATNASPYLSQPKVPSSSSSLHG